MEIQNIKELPDDEINLLRKILESGKIEQKEKMNAILEKTPFKKVDKEVEEKISSVPTETSSQLPAEQIKKENITATDENILDKTEKEEWTPEFSPEVVLTKEYHSKEYHSEDKKHGRNSNIDLPDKTKEGKEAEDYVREELKKLFGSEWRISKKPERDKNGREVDIVISHKRNGTTFSIEVKSVDRDLVFWSIGEVERAKVEKDKYFLAIVMKKSSELREVFVVKNPLETLKHLKRTGTWLWNKDREDGVKLDSEDWKEPSDKPYKPPDNFSFKIEGITREFLEGNENTFSLEKFVREILD
jgi:Holliday junction resolvase-like predicted endonuclease